MLCCYTGPFTVLSDFSLWRNRFGEVWVTIPERHKQQESVRSHLIATVRGDSALETEVGAIFVSLRPGWSTQQVLGQPVLGSETVRSSLHCWKALLEWKMKVLQLAARPSVVSRPPRLPLTLCYLHCLRISWSVPAQAQHPATAVMQIIFLSK